MQVNTAHEEYQCIETLHWRHRELDGGSNHQAHNWLLNRLFGRRSKKTPKLRVTGLFVGNSPVTGDFPANWASNAENVSIWWRHHECVKHNQSVCIYHGVHAVENTLNVLMHCAVARPWLYPCLQCISSLLTIGALLFDLSSKVWNVFILQNVPVIV